MPRIRLLKNHDFFCNHQMFTPYPKQNLRTYGFTYQRLKKLARDFKPITVRRNRGILSQSLSVEIAIAKLLSKASEHRSNNEFDLLVRRCESEIC